VTRDERLYVKIREKYVEILGVRVGGEEGVKYSNRKGSPDPENLYGDDFVKNN